MSVTLILLLVAGSHEVLYLIRSIHDALFLA
jgi:hypothetical protein